MSPMVDQAPGTAVAVLGVSSPEQGRCAGQRCGDHDLFPGPDHPHRPRPRGAGGLGPRTQGAAADGAAGLDRVGRRRRPAQRPDRPGPGRARGHGAQVAGPVRRRRHEGAGRPAPLRAPAGVRGHAWSPRSRRWPARCPPSTGCRCRGGRCRPGRRGRRTRHRRHRVRRPRVRRWLAADAIKPWRHRSWIFPRDPDFAAKAARVLDLYARVWEGRRCARTST